jgi:hypothetical protein
MLTEEGEKTARDCLERSGLDDTVGPSTHHSEVVLSDSDSDEPYEGSNPVICFIGFLFITSFQITYYSTPVTLLLNIITICRF